MGGFAIGADDGPFDRLQAANSSLGIGNAFFRDESFLQSIHHFQIHTAKRCDLFGVGIEIGIRLPDQILHGRAKKSATAWLTRTKRPSRSLAKMKLGSTSMTCLKNRRCSLIACAICWRSVTSRKIPVTKLSPWAVHVPSEHSSGNSLPFFFLPTASITFPTTVDSPFETNRVISSSC